MNAAAADAATGGISGSVIDGQGAVYEGANAILTIAGAPARNQTTDSTGRFSFVALPEGTYRLEIANAGFAPQSFAITLAAGQDYEVPPIKLVLSAMTSVHVTASDTPIAIAHAEVQLEEQQRVLGIVPNFFVAYDPNAPPLNAKLKFQLAWRDAIDPVNFLGAAALAGLEQADNLYSGYGQGAQGYGQRFGAAYANGFVSNIFGNAIYPALLRQDPRYFYQGTGTITSRAVHAVASSVICKGDNGRWQPNYSGVLGSLTAGGIADLYYPASNRNGAVTTLENTLLGTLGGAFQGLMQEFVVKRLTPKLPNYGAGH